MFICEIWGKFTSFIFCILVSLGRFQNFKKVNLVNLSQLFLLNMLLLVQIYNNKSYSYVQIKISVKSLVKSLLHSVLSLIA